MKNPDRPGDIHTLFQSMEPDLKQIIAAHPVVTEDGHPCDFIHGLFKAYMPENSPIDGRPQWELYFTSPHYQDFPSWIRSMLAGFLKKNRILLQQQTPNPFIYKERGSKRGPKSHAPNRLGNLPSSCAAGR